MSKVVMDPNDPNTLYASGRHQVYKTTNGGATWKANVVYTAPNYHDILDIAVSRNPGSAGLYFSEGPERCLSSTSGCVGWNCPLADGKLWYDPNFGSGPRADITGAALGITPDPSEVQFERALFSVTPNSVSILALSDQQTCPLTNNGDRIIARNTANGQPKLAASWTQHVNPAWAAGSHGSGYASAFAVSPVN